MILCKTLLKKGVSVIVMEEKKSLTEAIGRGKKKMMKQYWKRILSVICLLLILFAGFIYFCVPIQMGGNRPQSMKSLPLDMVLSKEEVEEDRMQAIQFVEDVHPYFVLEKEQSAYEEARQKYIDATLTEMSVGDFQAATAEYLCFFADGHTKVWWEEEEYILLEQVYQDGKTYLTEDDKVTDIWVTEIGGVDIETIYETMARVFPAENDMAVVINRNKYITGRNILTLAGAEIVEDSVMVTYSDGSTKDYKFVQAPYNNGEWKSNSWYMDGDIFVVDFNECVDDDNLKSIASELQSAISQGCDKIIIDVRGNGGGDSNACERLLEAMGMESPQYGMFIRYSSEAKVQAGYLRKSGTFRCHASKKSKTNEAVNLVVLSDRYTFSSATMLCVFVRDGNLGTLIGEPSSNMPSNYGDILYLPLQNSHLFACVSHKQFIRPDEDNKERMLVPDIQTSAEEAYDKAVTYLHEK